jgi:cysteine-rich repeat protein
MGGAGGVVGSGGAGGVVASGCGNGKLDPGEECDDKNKVDGDGCDSCDVACVGGGVEHPMTHHCYLIGGTPVGWDAAKISCEAAPGYYLAVLATVPEIDFIKLSPLADVWIGGKKVNNAWTWVNDEDWIYVDNMPPWRSGQPAGGADCVELGSVADGNDAGTLNDSDCLNPKPYLCERDPPVAP